MFGLWCMGLVEGVEHRGHVRHRCFWTWGAYPCTFVFVWGFTDISADLLHIIFWRVGRHRVLVHGCSGRRQTQGGGTGAQTLALGLGVVAKHTVFA